MDFQDIFGDNKLLITDYAVVGVALGVILVFGLYHSIFSNGSPENFLIGGRSTRTAPVAVSTAMLYFSALTVIDSPAEIYYYGIESFMFTLTMVVIVPVGAFLFASMMYRMQLTSVYQYLGHRFDSTTLRCFTSFVYVLHQICFISIVQGLVSSAMEKYFGVPILTSIIGLGAFTAISIALGGLSANIWIQVFSYHWMSLFLLIVSLVSASKAGGVIQAFQLAAEHERLRLFNFSLDPFQRHNFYNFLFGYCYIVLMSFASDQSTILRYSSLVTSQSAMKSIILSIPILIIPSVLCLLIGLFLQASYAGCDPLTLGKIEHPQDLIPYFVNANMMFIPGSKGFFIGAILGCALSICSTSLTSATACTYQDFISKLCCSNSKAREKAASTSTICCRTISLMYAAVATTLTIISVKLSLYENINLFTRTSNLFVFQYALVGPIAGVFIMAMFFPCINKYGAFLGFLGGLLCIGYVEFKVIASSTTNLEVSPLPPILGECPDANELNITFFRFIPWHPKDALIGSENIDAVMDEILKVSYLLFPLCGALLTIIIGFIVSIFTGGLCLCASRKVPAQLLHPALSFCDCCIDSEERELRHAISYRYVDRIASVHNLFPVSSTRLDSKPPSYKYSSVPNSPSSAMNYHT